MLLQPYKLDFILIVIKQVESREDRSHWALIKNSEVNNKHKNKDGKLKTILPICSFERKRLSYGILMKHKARIFDDGIMQQQGLTNGKLMIQWKIG